MPYKVVAVDGVLSMASGCHWSRGEVMAGTELPPRAIKALLDEGAIEPSDRLEDVLDVTTVLDPDQERLVRANLEAIEGITREHAVSLMRMGITTIAQVAEASDETLGRLWGVGNVTAKKIRQSARELSK